MSPLSGGRAWWICAAFMVLLLAPTAQAVEREHTLVARLPLVLDGDISANAEEALVHVAAERNGRVPQLEMLFTAAQARVTVTNWTESDRPGCATPLGGVVCERQGTSQPMDPDGLRDVQFLVHPRDGFAFFAMDGATRGATYHAVPLEPPARLDVTTRDQAMSYTDDPRGLDFTRPVPQDTIVLSDTGMRYEIRGDFTFVVHGADLAMITSDGTSTTRTGTWYQETDVEGTRLSSDRTTQFARVEVKDAVLTLTATGGVQELFAAVESIVLDVDGGISTDSAAGTIQIGDEEVRSRGDRVRAEGHFTLTPTYVVPGSGKQVVFGMRGEIDTLSVGTSRYLGDEAAIAVAATGAALLLAGFGAYFWPTAKTALILPFYAKLTKAKVLDQETRSLVHAKVESDPGCQVKQVADALDVSWTTAAYHLRVLTKMGMVVPKRNGRHEHFFVTGSPAAAGHALVATLQNDTARRILESILRQPGIIQKDLCDRLDIAPSTASGHLARLRDVGAVREEREWKMRRYYAGSGLDDVPLVVGPLESRAEGLAASA